MNKTNLLGTESIHPRVVKEFEYDIVNLLVSIYTLTFNTAVMSGVPPEPCIFASSVIKMMDSEVTEVSD